MPIRLKNPTNNAPFVLRFLNVFRAANITFEYLTGYQISTILVIGISFFSLTSIVYDRVPLHHVYSWYPTILIYFNQFQRIVIWSHAIACAFLNCWCHFVILCSFHLIQLNRYVSAEGALITNGLRILFYD